MKKLKDLCLSVLLKEGEEVYSLSAEQVGDVVDVKMIDDNLSISFETTYGKPADLVVKLSDFKKWSSNSGAADNTGALSKEMFRPFVLDFVENSEETSEDINEIVDDAGNIDLDGDMPNNSTNSLVTSPKFDLEKIYKSFIPKSIRFYSGGYGSGFIVW